VNDAHNLYEATAQEDKKYGMLLPATPRARSVRVCLPGFRTTQHHAYWEVELAGVIHIRWGGLFEGQGDGRSTTPSTQARTTTADILRPLLLALEASRAASEDKMTGPGTNAPLILPMLRLTCSTLFSCVSNER